MLSTSLTERNKMTTTTRSHNQNQTKNQGKTKKVPEILPGLNMSDVPKDLQSALTSIIKHFDNKLKEQADGMEFLGKQNNELRSELNEQRRENDQLKSEVKKLTDIITSLKNKEEFLATDIFNENSEKFEKLEQGSTEIHKRVQSLESKSDQQLADHRKLTLVISGYKTPIAADANLNTVVRDLITNKLKINLGQDDVTECRKIGKKPESSTSSTQCISFTVSNTKRKSEIMRACKKEKPPFYVNEHLTPTRSTIMYVLRKYIKQQEKNSISVKSFDGNVTVFILDKKAKKYNSRVINTKQNLEEFLQQRKTSLAKYHTSWPTP